jgi:hypothetical protein
VIACAILTRAGRLVAIETGAARVEPSVVASTEASAAACPGQCEGATQRGTKSFRSTVVAVAHRRPLCSPKARQENHCSLVSAEHTCGATS